MDGGSACSGAGVPTQGRRRAALRALFIAAAAFWARPTRPDSNNLWMAVEPLPPGATSVLVSVFFPPGFTNRVDFFTTTNLAGARWRVGPEFLPAGGTNALRLGFPLPASADPFYVTAANADVDSDGDGLSDPRERFVYRTHPGLPDTDGDGYPDGEEIAYGSDPRDPASTPAALKWVRAEGAALINEGGRPVTLRIISLSGWLGWEQWLLRYQPSRWTNEWGGVLTNELDEAMVREILTKRGEFSVTLQATKAPLKSSGVTTAHVWGAWTWLCPENVSYVGNFNNGQWIGFPNVDFGPGVSNLAIAVAVPNHCAGREIRVRLDDPQGTEVGVLTTWGTAPGGLWCACEWCTFAEQWVTLWTNVSGRHSVYFVASAPGNWPVGNLYRFRFCNEPVAVSELFETHRDNYVVGSDLDWLKALGYNCIRVPFLYTLLEDDRSPYVYLESGWARLDWIVRECAKRGLYVILTLQGAPGGQNGFQHCGISEPFRQRLWYSERFQDRTEKLWAAIAARYATNPAVVAYEVLNCPEPPISAGWSHAQAFSNNVLPVLSRLYTAIRAQDARHLVLMQGNFARTNLWSGEYWWWPAPGILGWSNVAYAFSVLDRAAYGREQTNGVSTDWYFPTQKAVCDRAIRALSALRARLAVPVWVIEFMPWNEQNFDYWTRQLEAHDFSWGHSSFRAWGWDNASRPEIGKTLWGLQYRSASTTNLSPHLTVDNWPTLASKIATYQASSYADNLHLQQVVAARCRHPETAKEMCDRYLNTFRSPDGVGPAQAWPLRKLELLGPSNCFCVAQRQGAVLLCPRTKVGVARLKSREEADARFAVADATGCWFSVRIGGIAVTGSSEGVEAALTLAIARDSVTSPLEEEDTCAVLARLTYDHDWAGSNVWLSLYAKSGGTNSWGELRAEAGPLHFEPPVTLDLWVNQDRANVAYQGTTVLTAAHALDLGTWPAGGVCALQFESPGAGWTTQMTVESITAGRPGPSWDSEAIEDLDAYPNGMELRALTETLSVEDYWAFSRNTASFVTNGWALWIPKECSPGGMGGTWLHLRRDYQNDVRLPAGLGSVIEASAAWGNLTGAIAKICFLPEYVPSEVFAFYAGTSLYVEVESTGAVIRLRAFRQEGLGTNRVYLGGMDQPLVDGQVISMQANSNQVRVYYGPDLFFERAHGLNLVEAFPWGVVPHWEVQNRSDATNAYVFLDRIRARTLATFTPPSP